MALSLGVRKGDHIKVGATMIEVVRVEDDNIIGLYVAGQPLIYVSDTEKTEILPDVWVFCGSTTRQQYDGYSRLAFEAPREIRIERVKG